MIDRTTIEKELNDSKKALGGVEREVKQLRDWISTNERSLSGMQDVLRRVTEDGILKVRGDLAQRENELQSLRTVIAKNERILGKLVDIERKQRDIASLESEQERIIVLLEKHRTELRDIQQEYEDLTRPVVSTLPPCEVVLPNNQRVSLNMQKGEYTIGWHDGSAQPAPDIDLQPLDGSALGVSRRHATLNYEQAQWIITDLGSTNGTFLNEMPLAANTPTALRDKTRIRLGSITIFFRYITQTTRL